MDIHFGKDKLKDLKHELSWSGTVGLNIPAQTKLVEDCLGYQEHREKTNQALLLAKDTLEKVQEGSVDQAQIAATIQEIWALL